MQSQQIPNTLSVPTSFVCGLQEGLAARCVRSRARGGEASRPGMRRARSGSRSHDLRVAMFLVEEQVRVPNRTIPCRCVRSRARGGEANCSRTPQSIDAAGAVLRMQ